MEPKKIKAKKLPATPGVYFFLGKNVSKNKGKAVKDGREILYIGKATSLNDRVKSYAKLDDLLATRGRRITQMVNDAEKISYETTDSVIEALVLEAHLIKQHQPLYNIREKDNKSFNYVVITEEDYPRVLTVRGRELAKLESEKKLFKQAGISVRPSRSQSIQAILRQTPIKKMFGPFTSSRSLQEALKLIRRIFPYRDRKCIPVSDQRDPSQPKPCFNRQIGLCPGVCTGDISKQEYHRLIRNITLFFEGKKRSLLQKLEREMIKAAKAHEFEKASERKRMINALTHLNDTALLTRDFLHGSEQMNETFGDRIEAYDIAHMAGSAHVGVMTVVEGNDAVPDQYRLFTIRTRQKADDTGALKEVLSRRFKHTEWEFPKLIVVDGAKAQKNTAEKILQEYGIHIPVVAVRKDEHHKPKDIIGKTDIVRTYQDQILLANSEAHRFAINAHRRKFRKR